MLPVALSLLALSIGSSYAAALDVRQGSPFPIDIGDTVLEGPLEGENITLPSGNSVVVICDARLGTGVSARSCFEALDTGPRDPRQETWVNDGVEPPAGHDFVQLPQMLFSASNRSWADQDVKDNTGCIIEPTLPTNYQVAQASSWNVTEAARAVIQACVIRRRLGGYAQYIGGDNRLNVRVLGNTRHAQCSKGIQSTPRSCQYILDDMYKDRRLEVFGKGHWQITVALPLTLRAPDGLCQVIIDTASPSKLSITSWFGVWVAISLVNAGCVRQGKGGKYAVPGKDQYGNPTKDLTVAIMDEPPGLALPGNQNSIQRQTPSAAAA
ncbi:MAG: hypothetical protein Q9216_005766 [Gyalolechia sp. 2 TL-2023]